MSECVTCDRDLPGKTEETTAAMGGSLCQGVHGSCVYGYGSLYLSVLAAVWCMSSWR